MMGSTLDERQRLRAVETFADHALKQARDRSSGKDTPLFVDGVEVDTGTPVTWLHGGRAYVISNLASQQNFFRTLVGLSALTGESRYQQAAMDATKHMFEHYRSPCGLLYWGGHTFVDLRSLEVVHIEGPHMEIKCHLPFYELMWQVDRDVTAQFIRAFWNGNMRDWRRLELNRHAPFNAPMGDQWESPWDDPEPFYRTEFHGSVMPFTDMTWSAAVLAHLNHEPGAMRWARRMAQFFAKARHPETGLGPAKATRMTWDSKYGFGAAAEKQFGAEFGELAREAWQLWGSVPRRLYVDFVLAQMAIAERHGQAAADFLEFPISGLKAYARHGYDDEHHHFRAMWADGTDMTGYVTKREGKPRSQTANTGDIVEPIPADEFLISYARAWRISGDHELWQATRRLARGGGLGDIGTSPAEALSLELGTTNADPIALLAILELHHGTKEPAYLNLAQRVGDNIVADRFRSNMFTEWPGHRCARFDAIEPLALVHLVAAERGMRDAVPMFIGGAHRYLQGPYDGHGRMTDQKLFYRKRAVLG